LAPPATACGLGGDRRRLDRRRLGNIVGGEREKLLVAGVLELHQAGRLTGHGVLEQVASETRVPEAARARSGAEERPQLGASGIVAPVAALRAQALEDLREFVIGIVGKANRLGAG